MTCRTLLSSSGILAALALVLPVRAETPLRKVIDAEVQAVWQQETSASRVAAVVLAARRGFTPSAFLPMAGGWRRPT
jgi:hypothetical protein